MRALEEVENAAIEMPAKQLVLTGPALDAVVARVLFAIGIVEESSDLEHSEAALIGDEVLDQRPDRVRDRLQSRNHSLDLLIDAESGLVAIDAPTVQRRSGRIGHATATDQHVVRIDTETSRDLFGRHVLAPDREVAPLLDPHATTTGYEPST